MSKNNINEKELIANICEELYKYCISQISQIENNKIIWIMNGSTLCNLLYNVNKIDGSEITEEFNKNCFDFIRKPKGDIDITYVANRPYKFNLDSDVVKRFQDISEEKRDYNFVDSNSVLSDNDLKEICLMETNSGFRFYAKKPQYLFLYKLRELISVFSKDILSNNIDNIVRQNKNIIRDVKCLYKIAVSYCGKDTILDTLSELFVRSDYLYNLYENNNIIYNELINKCLNILNVNYSNNKKII